VTVIYGPTLIFLKLFYKYHVLALYETNFVMGIDMVRRR
jgi:hypothetical protein